MVADQDHPLTRTRSRSLASLALFVDDHVVTASGLAVGLIFHDVGLGLDLVRSSGLLVLQILAEGEVGLVVPAVDANSVVGEFIPVDAVWDGFGGGLDGAGGGEGGKVNVDGAPGQITEGQVLPADRGERHDGYRWVGPLFIRIQEI